MESPGFYRASVETRNFEFEAYGYTQLNALAALRHCLMTHCDQYPSAYSEYLHSLLAEANVIEFQIGDGFRDGGREGTGPLSRYS